MRSISQLRPSPKWKLVVDVGQDATDGDDDMDVVKLNSLLRIVEANTPKDSSSPLVCLLPGFTSLRLLLVKENRSRSENDLLKSVLACYDSYIAGGRFEADIACMTARDFMALSKESSYQTNSAGSEECGRQVPSGAVQPTASANSKGLAHQTDINGVQYNCSSKIPQSQSSVSQLNGQQPVNIGFSALDVAISLAQNGLHLSSRETVNGSTDGSRQDPASLAISLGAAANLQTSPALHPISSHHNVAPIPITGHLADLVHHDSSTSTNMYQ